MTRPDFPVLACPIAEDQAAVSGEGECSGDVTMPFDQYRPSHCGNLHTCASHGSHSAGSLRPFLRALLLEITIDLGHIESVCCIAQ
jgi:hypothetical protein